MKVEKVGGSPGFIFVLHRHGPKWKLQICCKLSLAGVNDIYSLFSCLAL